jgi:hypothetical protein
MHYIAIAHFPKDSKSTLDIASRRRSYRYPAAFANVQSYLDVQGGRAVIHFETDDAKAILRYTADWPEVTFDLFPVVPSETAWETYATVKLEPTVQVG